MTAYEYCSHVLQLRDEALIQKFGDVMTARTLKKGEFIIRGGEVLHDIYFLDCGITRGYFLNDNGRDYTDCFSFLPGTACVPFSELEPNAVSEMYIEAMMESSFFVCPLTTVIQLKQEYAEVNELYVKLLLYSLQAHTELKRIRYQKEASERYRWFLEKYPGVMERVSNKYVASFLDMTPPYFSKVIHGEV